PRAPGGPPAPPAGGRSRGRGPQGVPGAAPAQVVRAGARARRGGGAAGPGRDRARLAGHQGHRTLRPGAGPPLEARGRAGRAHGGGDGLQRPVLRHPPHRRPRARRRQAGRPADDPRRSAAAHAGRGRGGALARRDGREPARRRRRSAAPARAGRGRGPPRVVGRRGLPAGRRRQGRAGGRPHRLRRRRLRRHDERPGLPAGAEQGRGGGGARGVRRGAVRPRRRAGPPARAPAGRRPGSGAGARAGAGGGLQGEGGVQVMPSVQELPLDVPTLIKEALSEGADAYKALSVVLSHARGITGPGGGAALRLGDDGRLEVVVTQGRASPVALSAFQPDQGRLATVWSADEPTAAVAMLGDADGFHRLALAYATVPLRAAPKVVLVLMSSVPAYVSASEALPRREVERLRELARLAAPLL